MIKERLRALREEMSRHSIDVYIVPTCDFHGSEYIGEYFKTREYIIGFTGSAGTAVVTTTEAYLWTDGRYFLQAEQQLNGTGIILMKEGEGGVPTVVEFLEKSLDRNAVVGFDGRMISTVFAEEISSMFDVKSHLDLVGSIWKDRPNISAKPIWKLDDKYTGKSCSEKLNDIRQKMEKEKVDGLLVTALDEIAWTLNLRGNDIAYTPVFLAFLYVDKEQVKLFVQKESLSDEIIKYLEEYNIEIEDYFGVYSYLTSLNESRLWIDAKTANFNVLKALARKEVYESFTPAFNMKAVKNYIEIENMKKAHIEDGIAMTKFIYWLKNTGEDLTEISVAEKLEEFRQSSKKYLEPSFAPIVGYMDHGAIVHYSATEETSYEIKKEGIVLIDSGGQYISGTTDITRTISLGDVTAEMKEMYTTVLKGHLSLMGAVFKEGCTGVSLDVLARKPLWDKGLDYNHGTGHGVGYLLNVHEGPNAFRYKISKEPKLNAVLQPGMITSNEPGVYLEGKFGIRIENLILCVERNNGFLGFEPLTLVPYDKELINIDELSKEEKSILSDYNKKVYETLKPFLSVEEKEWLKQQINI